MKSRHSALVKQDEALSAYFEALLTDGPEPQPLFEEPVEVVEAVPVAEVPLPEVVVATPVLVPVEIPEVQETVAVEVEEELLQPRVEGAPDWAEGEFQALLFTCAGLTLAVPLSELNGIQVWHGEKVTPMPGHVSWYLGLMNYRDISVPVIDTAQLVLPEDRAQRLSGDPRERQQRIVFIGDRHWGLACDGIEQVITLTPEQVKWRSSRSKRRWLAGTVLEHMCAIIDPPAFADMLATGLGDVSESDDTLEIDS